MKNNEISNNNQISVTTSSEVAKRAREQIATNQPIVVRQVSYMLDGVMTNGTAICLSQFGTIPASIEEIVAECEKLMSAFPMSNIEQQKTFYSLLYNTIKEEGMSLNRLRYAVRKIITENKYGMFRIADVVGYDKKLNLAKSIGALKHIFKPRELDYDDIVILWGSINGMVCRLYGLREEVENSVYADRIVGVWDNSRKYWKWVGSINDPTIPNRQLAFRRSLFKYCNQPPTYNGKYDTDIVKQFYEKYSRVVPPNDMLLFEATLGWDVELYLENFYQQQKLKNNELTSENH